MVCFLAYQAYIASMRKYHLAYNDVLPMSKQTNHRTPKGIAEIMKK
ncbi:hypothetical protein HMPREF3212_04109 [Citrobacter freundii]|nr:hypothetical protein HMPREF3212_04109 [Citrobacter freundii]